MTVESETTRSIEAKVEIDATPDAVWRALTDADELVRWFPLEARVEPGEGGSLFMSWQNEFSSTMPITVWEPGRRVAYAFFPEYAPSPQVADFLLEGEGGRTVLRVVHSGFPKDAEWDGWYDGTRLGWGFELQSLKRYLEGHAGEDRAVVYLRRRIPAEPEAIWDRIVGPDGVALETSARPAAGQPYRATAADGSPMTGDVLHHEPPGASAYTEFAGLVSERGGGLFRIGMDAARDEPGSQDLVVWLQAWGDQAGAVDAQRPAWERKLEELFPDGAAR